MSWRLVEVVSELSIDATVLRGWIEQRWIRPTMDDGEPLFDEADMARARLIAELRQDFNVSDEAMPVVLKLLDQVYALRGQMRAIARAVEGQPEPVRAAILAAIRG